MGIIGLGAIGPRGGGKRLLRWGWRWSHCGARLARGLPAFRRCTRCPNWRRFSRDPDVVVVAAPLTAETRGLIGAAQLRRMKPGAILINVSRGKLLREAEVAEALAKHTIAGAALDVFEHEPLDPASPLWDLPNVVITPHTSAFRRDYWEAAVALFADNLERFLRGLPLVNLVDKAAGY